MVTKCESKRGANLMPNDQVEQNMLCCDSGPSAGPEQRGRQNMFWH